MRIRPQSKQRKKDKKLIKKLKNSRRKINDNNQADNQSMNGTRT